MTGNAARVSTLGPAARRLFIDLAWAEARQDHGPEVFRLRVRAACLKRDVLAEAGARLPLNRLAAAWGCSLSALKHLGKSVPTRSDVERIATGLAVPASWLLTGNPVQEWIPLPIEAARIAGAAPDPERMVTLELTVTEVSALYFAITTREHPGLGARQIANPGMDQLAGKLVRAITQAAHGGPWSAVQPADPGKGRHAKTRRKPSKLP